MRKLGQHFLTSKKIAHEIIETAELNSGDTVLEIGPGKGFLTEELAAKAGKVIAIERDEFLFNYLKDKFKDQKNLELILGDALTTDPAEHGLENHGYKVVANIPYYITSRFLRVLLESDRQPSSMVLMIQKEVAERIVSQPPKMSLLSVSVQAYGQPSISVYVPAKHFAPPPEVDSAVINIKAVSKDFFTSNALLERDFFEIVKRGFSHKRKMLKNNLSAPAEILKKCGINEKARAQDLSLDDWKNLAKLMGI